MGVPGMHVQKSVRDYCCFVITSILMEKARDPNTTLESMDCDLKRNRARNERFWPDDVKEHMPHNMQAGYRLLEHHHWYPDTHFWCYGMCKNCHHVYTSDEPPIPVPDSNEEACPSCNTVKTTGTTDDLLFR